jgi:ribonucleoside-diphosphate reductase alpha chain
MTLKGEWSYSDNAIAIYKRLYFDKLKGETKPSQTHARIAEFIANTPAEKSKFFNLLDKKIFRPNSPCMINAGSYSKNPHDNALSACYVLGLEDSMDSIIEMWGVCAKIYASGAGSGIPITNLREKGANISTGGAASGPLAYLNVVDMLSNTVRSGGKTRRAANMGIFKYNHPDIMKILDAKLNGEIQTFNLSMSVTDYFMENLDNERKIILKSPQNRKKSKKKSKRISIDKIWEKVIHNAWANGDPGLFFYDIVNKFNPFPSLGDIDCTNPCGEVPLPPWSVCNIGSINVSHFVNKYDKDHTFSFNWDDFKNTVGDCFTFLDNVIDKQEYIHLNFQKNAKDYRPVGLGIMGFADALIKLNISYESQEAIDFFETLCYHLNKECIKQSIKIAKDPNTWNINIPNEDYKYFKDLIKYYIKSEEDENDDEDKILKDFEEYGIHNSNWTMIAPTGSTSMSADCSYAWEPLMALVWEKPLVESDKVLKIIHPQFEKDLEELIKCGQFSLKGNSNIIKKSILNDIIDDNGSIQNIEYFPAHMKSIYKVAHDIDPLFKIKMQGAGQKWISMAISSTTNLPNNATEQDVKDIYTAAWKAGLKGITVFRDGCREDQIVHFGKKLDSKQEKLIIRERPIKRDGSTVEIKTPHGKFYVTVNFVDERPIEMFFSIGKQGGLVNVIIDALARICSKGLQAGMDMNWIVDTLEGLKGDSFWFKMNENEEKSTQADSIVDALSKVLEHHFIFKENKTRHTDDSFTGFNRFALSNSKLDPVIHADDDSFIGFNRCPECQKKGLTYRSGCRGGECIFCGFSNCS